MATPYVTIVRNVVASTQDLAASEYERTGRPTLVVAAEQTAGRGRTGNVWWQASRGAAASLALSVAHLPDHFTLAVGLAVRSAISEVVDRELSLKWPNDLEHEGRKVGGILVELSGSRVTVGCGLNLYWPDAPPGAGALFDDDPGTSVGRRISEAWASRVVDGPSWDRLAYVAACATVGETVTWSGGGPALAVDVDEDGGLVVSSDAGTTTLRYGQVRSVRVSGDA